MNTRLTKFLKENLICPASFNKHSHKKEFFPVKITKTKIYFKDNHYDIVRGVPDLRMPEDREYTSYDDILTDWKSSLNIQTDNHYKKHLKANRLNKFDIENKVVLMAGVGSGREISLILKLDPKIIIAIDFSNSLINVALDPHFKNKNIIFIMGDLCNLSLKEKCIDYIFSAGVIHHTRSPELAHRNLWRVLKNNGFLNYSHIYLENLHNRRVSIDRLRFNLHNKNRKSTKLFLKFYCLIYKFLIKTRILKLINRKIFRFPFLLELNGNVKAQDFYTGAIDYYLPKYRHTIKEEDIFDWFLKCGAKAERTPKGFISQKII